MLAPRRILLRSTAALAVVALCTAAAVVSSTQLLPRPGACAVGLRVSGETIPPAVDFPKYFRDRAERIESREIRLVLADNAAPETVSLQQLGVRVDIDALNRRVLAVGREGSLEERLDQALLARDGRLDIPLTWTIDPSPLIERLDALKEDVDQHGTPARFDFATDSVVPHTNGKYLDLFATLEALDLVTRKGGEELRVVFVDVPPFASEQMLRKLDISQIVGHYETRFGYLGGQADRAHNIATAASRLDGVVVLPSQVLSFNRLVGHRTLENGFRKGWEIFRGEMVQGVGGGTCQVASTLHAAAFLAGFDVVERSPHSRPSGYIPLGLDATVVDGLVDLKLRNPFPFPVVLHSVVQDGVITFDLRGEQRLARVAFHGDVVDIQRYKRKVTQASWLPEGRVLRKQRGIRGYRVRKTRTIVLRDGTTREDITTDVYPPTFEILLVPPGTDEETLPPLPFAASGSASPDLEAPSQAPASASAAPVIEDSPEARHSSPPQVHRETIIQR